MGKGKTFGGIGIGCIVSAVIAGLLMKKKKDVLGTMKNSGILATVTKLLEPLLSDYNEKEVT